ncbi:hypothetical protein COM59_24210 [Bacillus pseudomycoides]|uniref:DUF2321 domain-containing protein n=1 Tax=Bacillus pseudomycoides TaxID=64104 RepID=UPI000BF7F1B1|nr:DUF2321 domain-containing protein [Bacillus pseudomycoides]PGF06488.1 hypothetical protein COM59_24210 [Bacillus pseudomycoides]
MTKVENWHDTAQICLSGHIISDSVTIHPKRKQDFCDKCGEETIMFCQGCNANIRGEYHEPNAGDMSAKYTLPDYCYSCGKPYPWTESALEAAKELAKEVEGLTPDEQEILSQSIDDIVKNGPKTAVATTRFKKLATKFSSGIGNAFREILVDVVSESVKKTLWS